jgi:hypothetical protein
VFLVVVGAHHRLASIVELEFGDGGGELLGELLADLGDRLPGLAPHSPGGEEVALRTEQLGQPAAVTAAYAGTSPITRASGKKKVVLTRYVHNDRLIDALDSQAFTALQASPGARAYYDRLRAREVCHHAALHQVANRLVGVLH